MKVLASAEYDPCISNATIGEMLIPSLQVIESKLITISVSSLWIDSTALKRMSVH